jgi:hypothetical protein
MDDTRLEIALKLGLRLTVQVVVLREAEPAPAPWNHHSHFWSIKRVTLQGSDQLISRQAIHFGSDDIKNSLLQVDHCICAYGR